MRRATAGSRAQGAVVIQVQNLEGIRERIAASANLRHE